MTALVLRFRTDPVTCIRHWFYVLNTAPPEHVVALVGPCTRAGALAAAVVAGAVPFGPPAWLGPQYASGARESASATPTGAVPLASPGIFAQTPYAPNGLLPGPAVWETLPHTPVLVPVRPAVPTAPVSPLSPTAPVLIPAPPSNPIAPTTPILIPDAPTRPVVPDVPVPRVDVDAPGAVALLPALLLLGLLRRRRC